MGNETRTIKIHRHNNTVFQVSNNIEIIDRISFNIISLIGAGG